MAAPFVRHLKGLNLMIIMIAMAYVPILVILTVLAVYLGKRLYLKADSPPVSRRANTATIIAGAVIATALALLAAWLIPVEGSMDWNALFLRILVILVLPFVIGALLILLGRSWPVGENSHRVSITLNRLGVGSFHAVWLIPLSGLFYVAWWALTS